MERSSQPSAPRSARRAVLEVLLAGALFGTTGTAAAFAPTGTSSVAIGAARLVIGGAGLLALVSALGGSRRAAVGLWRTRIGVLAGLMTAFSQGSFFVGVSATGVALGTLITLGSVPILVGLISWAALGERPVRSWWASTAVCLGGLVLLTADAGVEQSHQLIGVAFALAAGAGYAAYTVAMKQMIRNGAHSAEATAAAFGLAGLIMLPVLVLAGAGWLLSPTGLVVGLWIGLVATTLAYVLFGRGLRMLPAGPVATLTLAEPLVATLLGVFVLGETLGVQGWLGAALVAAGLALQGVSSARSGRAGFERPMATMAGG